MTIKSLIICLLAFGLTACGPLYVTEPHMLIKSKSILGMNQFTYTVATYAKYGSNRVFVDEIIVISSENWNVGDNLKFVPVGPAVLEK